jgi:alkylation response protein AidB-like acyl-CoA dehydrogenase
MTTAEAPSLLSDEMLQRFRERAAGYDKENKFALEDFDELVGSGFLKMNIPAELGGMGYNLSQTGAELRRLAQYAPATAVAINMHLYWMGTAADVWRSGDKSCEWMLTDGAKGEVFAAGHAESGNDLPLLLSTARADKVDGGWKITGRKMFGSLSPVWTRYGFHAMDTSNPDAPKIVHGFLPREAIGYSIDATWDVLGMRASMSNDTIMDGAICPDNLIGRIVPAGPAGVDMFVLAVFANALIGLGNVYFGAALRAREVAIQGAHKKTSLALTRSMAYHPHVQHSAAEIDLMAEYVGALLDRVAVDWSNGVDHGMTWPAKIVGAKYTAVESAKKIVDIAMDMSGGSGFFRVNELERLYRDVRGGAFHPANSALTHEIVGKTALGIGLDENPRWG